MAAFRTFTLAVAGCLALAAPVCSAVPASASTSTGTPSAADQVEARVALSQQTAARTADAQQAAQLAVAQGYRTGIAYLDLDTGEYSGAGEDTALFPSESVAKVLIATELLLTGQMNGVTDARARQMISASDDDAADALYPLAGGDDVLPRVAAHYGIPGLGAPPTTPGWWGLTQINARGLVQLYAALAHDPAVAPWLTDAMAHARPVASDGTAQLFGLPAAVPGSAVKQGWGHEAVNGSQAVAHSTGYVAGHLAVAILTEGPPTSYLAGITAVLTAQAQALLAGIAPPPSPAAAPASDLVAPSTRTHGPDLVPVALALAAAGTAAGAAYGGFRLLRLVRAAVDARRERKRALRAEQRRRRALAAAARSGANAIRLPDGRVVRLAPRHPAAVPARTVPATVRAA